MKTKITTRIPAQIAERLVENNTSLSDVCAHMLEAYEVIYTRFVTWMKNTQFTKAELSLILDASQGVRFSPDLMARFYDSHLRASLKEGRLDKKWRVDQEEFLQTLIKLSFHERVMLHDWSYRYWHGKWKDRPTIEEYVS